MKPENISVQNGIEHVFRKCPTCGEWGWVKPWETEVCVFCRKEAVADECASALRCSVEDSAERLAERIH